MTVHRQRIRDLPSEDWDRLTPLLRAFEDAWRRAAGTTSMPSSPGSRP